MNLKQISSHSEALDKLKKLRAARDEIAEKIKNHPHPEEIPKLTKVLAKYKLVISELKKIIPKNLFNPLTKEFLEKLGEVHEVKMSDGKIYGAVIITIPKIENFGINLKTVFSDCPGDRGFSHRDDYLTDINLHQQTALLKAIISKSPEITDYFGFFNLKAGQTISDKLVEMNLCEKEIDWFWTGEKFDQNKFNAIVGAKSKDDYKNQYLKGSEKESIINIEQLVDPRNHDRTIVHQFNNKIPATWYEIDPSHKANTGVVILGGVLEEE